MNLLIKRSSLFFSVLLALASCEDPTDIGVDLHEPVGTYYTDTISVNTSTILLNDSINAFKSSPLLAGFMTDQEVGTVTASTFTELALSSGSVQFGNADSLIDASLFLDYQFYGDGSKPLKLNVYQLTENFNEEQSYFTSSQIPYDATPIGTITFTPDFITVNKKPLAIPLTDAFARSIFSRSGKTELSSQQEFIKFIKGIAIVPAPDQDAGSTGSVILFDPFSQRSRLALNYMDKSVQGEPKYSTYNLLIRESSARFNRITGDRTGSLLSSLVKPEDDIPSAETNHVTYLQAGSGIRTKITFPYLDELKKRHGNIAINKAELIIPLKSEAAAALTPPPLLFLYESANNRILTTNRVQKAVQTDGGAFLNSVNNPAALILKSNSYRLVMTSYVQAMLSGRKPKELILSTTSNAVSVARGVINAEPDVEGNPPANRIRLKVYFSKIN